MSTTAIPFYWLSDTLLAGVREQVQAHAQRWAQRWSLNWAGPGAVRALTHAEAATLLAMPAPADRSAWLRGPDAIDALLAQWLRGPSESDLLGAVAQQAWRELCLDAYTNHPSFKAPAATHLPGHWGIEVLLPWPDGLARRLLLPLELLRHLAWWSPPQPPALPRWQAAEVLAQCPLTLPINLGQVRLRLDELQTLEVGDVILLDSPAHSAMAALPDPKAGLQGLWGHTGGRASLKVQRLTNRSE